MRLRRFAAVAILALLAQGCQEGDLLTAPTSAARIDGTWRLVKMESGGVALTEAPTAGRFAVTFADDRVLLKAECNTCSGSTKLNGDELTIEPMACTRAFCQSSPLDVQVTAAVQGTHTVRLDATRLVLTSPRGEVRFQR